MNELMAIFAGVGLAAACGFRVFVPLFAASLAANMGIDVSGTAGFAEMLGENFEWLGSTPVTLALGAATVMEVGGYYIPWVDNLLDTIATPAALIAGTFITGALMPDFMGDGSLKWIFSAIAGGGSAGLVQTASVITRGTSTATTGGMGNPVISTVELGGSVATASLAVLLPIGIAVFVVLIVIFFVLRKIIGFCKSRGSPGQSADSES
ncbi:MAG: hypothetical protein ACI81V_000623 [Lentimonas sp.]|jgi:hypothetical protein